MTTKNIEEINRQVENIESLKAKDSNYQLSEGTEIIDLFKYILSVDNSHELQLNQIIVSSKELKEIFKTKTLAEQIELLYKYTNLTDFQLIFDDNDFFYFVNDFPNKESYYHYLPYGMEFGNKEVEWNEKAFEIIKKNLAILKNKYNIK